MRVSKLAFAGALFAGAAVVAAPASFAGAATPAAECPGPNCYQLSVSPGSGPAGTTITVRVTQNGCLMNGSTAVLRGPARAGATTGAPIVATGQINSGAAGSVFGTIAVPAGTAPGAYVVEMLSSPNAGCAAPFTVTGKTTPLTPVTPAKVKPRFTG